MSKITLVEKNQRLTSTLSEVKPYDTPAVSKAFLKNAVEGILREAVENALTSRLDLRSRLRRTVSEKDTKSIKLSLKSKSLSKGGMLLEEKQPRKKAKKFKELLSCDSVVTVDNIETAFIRSDVTRILQEELGEAVMGVLQHIHGAIGLLSGEGAKATFTDHINADIRAVLENIPFHKLTMREFVDQVMGSERIAGRINHYGTLSTGTPASLNDIDIAAKVFLGFDVSRKDELIQKFEKKMVESILLTPLKALDKKEVGFVRVLAQTLAEGYTLTIADPVKQDQVVNLLWADMITAINLSRKGERELSPAKVMESHSEALTIMNGQVFQPLRIYLGSSLAEGNIRHCTEKRVMVSEELAEYAHGIEARISAVKKGKLPARKVVKLPAEEAKEGVVLLEGSSSSATQKFQSLIQKNPSKNSPSSLVRAGMVRDLRKVFEPDSGSEQSPSRLF